MINSARWQCCVSSSSVFVFASNAPKDLSRLLADFRAVFSICERSCPAEIKRFFFSISKNVLPPCCILWSRVRNESDLLNVPPTPKWVLKPKAWNFSSLYTAAHLLSCWMIWRRLGGVNLNLNLKSSIIKKYYKTIDGKEAESFIFYYEFPVITKMKIKFFLNPPMIY